MQQLVEALVAAKEEQQRTVARAEEAREAREQREAQGRLQDAALGAAAAGVAGAGAVQEGLGGEVPLVATGPIAGQEPQQQH